MRNKYLILIIIVLVLLVLSGIAFYQHYVLVPEKAILSKCPNFEPNWSDFVDCYGIITINDGWDKNYLSLKDRLHNYEVARVYNLDQIVNAGDNIYVINRKTIEGSVSDGSKIQYYQELFQNGKLTTNYYDSTNSIPTYLVINYKTGEVRSYKDINMIPEIEKSYFAEIKNK